MSTHQSSLVKPTTLAALSFMSMRSSVLQRKCACGGKACPDGECEECRKKKLQRKPQNSELGTRDDAAAPPIVHEVLRMPGQPLDASARAYMEPRLGHDFSQVRVHVDARAAESARAVGASAYTLSQHIVFGGGKFAPFTVKGQLLLAHELTHVVQQSTQALTSGSEDRQTQPPDDRILIGAENSGWEREADQVATAVTAPGPPVPVRVAVSSSSPDRTLAREPDSQPPTESEQKTDLKTMRLARFPGAAITQWNTLSLNEQRLVLIRMTGMYGADFAAAFLPFARGQKKPNISTSIETGDAAALLARGFRFAGDFGGVPTWVHPSGQEVKLLAKGRDLEDCANLCSETESEDECNACCEASVDANNPACRSACKVKCGDKL